MLKNIKLFIIIILSIIILRYIIYNKNNDNFTPSNLDTNITNAINSKCTEITKNINYILKATDSSINNSNNLIFNRPVQINNLIIKDNLEVKELSLNNDLFIAINYAYDENNTITPTTIINTFPNNTIVAYNMITTHITSYDFGTTDYTYNLPPGWVKCDGRGWYIIKNTDTAVTSNYIINNIQATRVFTNERTLPDSNKTLAYIETPDLRGRFVYGVDSNHQFGTVGGQTNVKLDISQISHDHLTHIGISGITNVLDSKLLLPTTIKDNASSSFHHFTPIAVFGGNVASSDATKQKYMLTTSDYYDKAATPNQPHNNMPPYYTLVYIMKIATIVIYT